MTNEIMISNNDKECYIIDVIYYEENSLNTRSYRGDFRET